MWIGILGITFALALIILLIYLIFDGQQARSEAALPHGRVLFADQGVAHDDTGTLYSDALALKGRPDYLIQSRDGGIIPVELKSGKSPTEYPYASHVMQLAAYCFLVDENYGIRPTHGIIQYQDNAWEVPYTDALEDELLALLKAMHHDRLQANVDRSHAFPRRCAACSVRYVCDQSLAGGGGD